MKVLFLVLSLFIAPLPATEDGAEELAQQVFHALPPAEDIFPDHGVLFTYAFEHNAERFGRFMTPFWGRVCGFVYTVLEGWLEAHENGDGQ